MDLSLAIAQGFHNAPKLYGDKTVRPVARISGIKSGLKAAGEEFVFGVYDGWTGLVKQPYSGAKASGAKGFAKGLGRGVGGWVLKDIGAVVGPIGYTLKGLQKEFSRSQKYSDEFIEEARKIQGRKDYTELEESERIRVDKAVADAWRVIANLKRREEDMRTNGVRGRIEMIKERRRWQRHGVFDSVEQAARALEAQRQGKDFEEVFRDHRRVVEKNKKPRKSTMHHSKRLATQKAGVENAEPAGEDTGPEPNGTIVASDRTGTDVQDLATDTRPPAAEALVNSTMTPARPTMTGALNNDSARDSSTGTAAHPAMNGTHNSKDSARDSGTGSGTGTGTGTPSETQPGWAKDVAARIFDTPAAKSGGETHAAGANVSSVT